MAIIKNTDSKINLKKQIISNDSGKLRIDKAKFERAINVCGGFNFNDELIYVKVKPKVTSIYACDTDVELISIIDTDDGISIKYVPVNAIIIRTIDDIDTILEKIELLKSRGKFKTIEKYLK